MSKGIFIRAVQPLGFFGGDFFFLNLIRLRKTGCNTDIYVQHLVSWMVLREARFFYLLTRNLIRVANKKSADNTQFCKQILPSRFLPSVSFRRVQHWGKHSMEHMEYPYTHKLLSRDPPPKLRLERFLKRQSCKVK